MATQARVSRAGSIQQARSAEPVRRVFTSRLSSTDSVPATTPTVGSQAWGTVRIVVNDDDSFEYLATIYNPMEEAFSGAFLQRGGGAPGDDVVATLFSDVALRSRYIQLRGTMSLPRGTSAGVLAEELREHPRAFAVSVHRAGAALRPAIRGAIE